jgi:predicted Zn-dependent peptidase
MLNVLTSGPESVFEKLLVDTGKVASIDSSQEPTRDTNLAVMHFTLAPGQSHSELEKTILTTIEKQSVADIAHLVKKVKANLLTEELFSRTSSLHIAQELTEYVASGDWENYANTPDLLNTITAKMVVDCMKTQFQSNNLTIGTFIGK